MDGPLLSHCMVDGKSARRCSSRFFDNFECRSRNSIGCADNRTRNLHAWIATRRRQTLERKAHQDRTKISKGEVTRGASESSADGHNQPQNPRSVPGLGSADACWGKFDEGEGKTEDRNDVTALRKVICGKS